MATMLDGRNNTIPLLWETKSVFMQNCLIVSAIQHGCHANPQSVFHNYQKSPQHSLFILCEESIMRHEFALHGNAFW